MASGEVSVSNSRGDGDGGDEAAHISATPPVLCPSADVADLSGISGSIGEAIRAERGAGAAGPCAALAFPMSLCRGGRRSLCELDAVVPGRSGRLRGIVELGPLRDRCPWIVGGALLRARRDAVGLKTQEGR
jgi:hypothetical protein